MYSFTRSVMESQLARMQSGIRKAVRSTKGMEMPSTPMWKLIGAEPRPELHELELRGERIEVAPQDQRQGEDDQRGPQRDEARVAEGAFVLRRAAAR